MLSTRSKGRRGNPFVRRGEQGLLLMSLHTEEIILMSGRMMSGFVGDSTQTRRVERVMLERRSSGVMLDRGRKVTRREVVAVATRVRYRYVPPYCAPIRAISVTSLHLEGDVPTHHIVDTDNLSLFTTLPFFLRHRSPFLFPQTTPLTNPRRSRTPTTKRNRHPTSSF